MGFLIRLIFLLSSLALAGSAFAWTMAEMFTTAEEVLWPFLICSVAILAAAIGYLVSSFRRR